MMLLFYGTEGLRAIVIPCQIQPWDLGQTAPPFQASSPGADSTGSWKVVPLIPTPSLSSFTTSDKRGHYTLPAVSVQMRLPGFKSHKERQMFSLECRSPNLRHVEPFGVWGHYCHVLKEHQRRRHLGMFSSVCTLDMKPGMPSDQVKTHFF